MSLSQSLSAWAANTSSEMVNGKPVREMEYSMRPFMEQWVDSYVELNKKSKSDLRPAKTSFLDETKLEDDDSKPGALQYMACEVLMKTLYGARLARFDLLRAVGALATNITKSKKVRRRLGRTLQLTLYSDVDFAGCPESAAPRSTPEAEI
eukprot:5823724-Heterocapsa_arctica.AAC.1